jgi:MYXO-CTERM domain-containing protein
MYWQLLLQVAAASSTSSTPRRLAFVPEHHVDFIFSVQPDGFSSLWIGLAVLLAVLVVWLRRRRQGQDRV